MVKNAPAYSGIKRRRYNVQHPDIQEINVGLRRLDDVIPENVMVNFIKIDVEGGEFDVLKGAERLLKGVNPLLSLNVVLVRANFMAPVLKNSFVLWNLFLKCRYSLSLHSARDMTR